MTGTEGKIRTVWLPSGDLAVSGPSSGPLEQIMFDICRWDGVRNTKHGDGLFLAPLLVGRGARSTVVVRRLRIKRRKPDQQIWLSGRGQENVFAWRLHT